MTGSVAPLRPALRRRPPGLMVERGLWDSGADVVVGMDEVGRGAWAGPISVGAAVLPRDRRVYKVRDSKLLSGAERESLFDRIAEWCVAWAVGHATADECDALGMSAAQRLAAQRALQGLGIGVDAVVVDGSWDFAGHPRTLPIVGADRTCLSVAAASILAKVTRDRIMRAAATDYPHWWFEDNKGYPGPRHQAALQWFGPSAIHRRSWVFMDGIVWSGVRRFQRPDAQGTLFPSH
ncbi:MAG TPA: ribonuclease HII [Actinobacteria bacterium]|nr:ribonuclease HII [Actinomycetota bacterium]